MAARSRSTPPTQKTFQSEVSSRKAISDERVTSSGTSRRDRNVERLRKAEIEHKIREREAKFLQHRQHDQDQHQHIRHEEKISLGNDAPLSPSSTSSSMNMYREGMTFGEAAKAITIALSVARWRRKHKMEATRLSSNSSSPDRQERSPPPPTSRNAFLSPDSPNAKRTRGSSVSSVTSVRSMPSISVTG